MFGVFNTKNDTPDASSCARCSNKNSTTSQSPVDDILETMKQHRFTIAKFLKILLETPAEKRSDTHSNMLTKFLNGESNTKPDDIAELMLQHQFSTPRAKRNHAGGLSAEDKHRRDPELMAGRRLVKWAIRTALHEVWVESKGFASKGTGLHVPNKNASWDFVHQFSIKDIADVAGAQCPTVLAFLEAIACPSNPDTVKDKPASSLGLAHSPEKGRGRNRRDPRIVIIVALLMLINARNLQCSVFQKIVGSWLFANGAAQPVFSILSRIGLSVAYSSTLKFLEGLSKSAQLKIATIAVDHRHLLIYDNINRKRRVWDPELGQQDTMDSGTAAAMVMLEDFEDAAFDPQKLQEAHILEERRKLTVDVLYQRINWGKLNSRMALHCLTFLGREVPELSAAINTFVRSRLKTTLAGHRMRDGRRTTVFPLGTSNHNEGTTGGNKQVLKDLMVNQLGLKEEDVNKILTIIGGDQSTIEKLRTLKRFLAECEHGYECYGWVIPLIQLWHMGWSDLERILATHWGKEEGTDSSTMSFMNERLGRKVKNVKRPDFYPAQALVFDTLEAEILDCWRVVLKVTDLKSYFSNTPDRHSIDELLDLAHKICESWITADAHDRALYGIEIRVPQGSTWNSSYKGDDQPTLKDPCSDHVLANACLRMKDSLLHYEFQTAIADGDIGRAMDVMSVWVFTFTGSGHNKYANELLEITCNFEWEYSNELKTAVLNNWLVNLSGAEGGWHPGDLELEHEIRQLKSMSKERATPFGDKRFREVIARNSRHFLDVKDTMNRAMLLNVRGGSHRRKRKEIGLKQLATAMKEQELHLYRPGRSHRHHARDDFEAGYTTLSDPKRLHMFVVRTLELGAESCRTNDGADQRRDDEDSEVQDNERVPPSESDQHGEGEIVSRKEQNERISMPNMYYDGVFVAGGDVSSDDDDTESDDPGMGDDKSDNEL